MTTNTPDNETPLTRYLRETGENLSALAARMGRAPSTLTRPLRGERDPSLDLARDIERATAGRVTAVQFMEICLAASDGPASETAQASASAP